MSNYLNKQTNKTNEAHCQGCFNPQRKTALSRWFLMSVTFFFFSIYRIKTTNCLHTCDEPEATCEYNHYSTEVLRSICPSNSQMPWGGRLWLIQSERVSAPSLYHPPRPPYPLHRHKNINKCSTNELGSAGLRSGIYFSCKLLMSLFFQQMDYK